MTRLLVGALCDIAVTLGIVLCCVIAASESESLDFLALGIFCCAIFCIMPAFGAAFGLLAWKESSYQACRRFRDCMLVLAILASLAGGAAISLTVLCWHDSTVVTTLSESLLLGLSLLGSLLTIPVAIMFWISFACAQSGFDKVCAHFASGGFDS